MKDGLRVGVAAAFTCRALNVTAFDKAEEGGSVWKEFCVFSFVLFLALGFFTELKGLFCAFETYLLEFGVSLPNKSLGTLSLSCVMLALLYNTALGM